MQTSTIDSVPSFNKVLLATDFSAASQAAFQTALDVCTAFQASLSILHVFEYANTVPPEIGGRPLELNSLYESARSSLDRLLQEARRSGVACEATMGSGIPSVTILETLTSDAIDLAILGTNALHGFERLIFGSTAEVVLRKASCPVLTVGPQAANAPRADQIKSPVVFATDFHLSTTRAICYAAAICKATRSPLHCLHVLLHQFLAFLRVRRLADLVHLPLHCFHFFLHLGHLFVHVHAHCRVGGSGFRVLRECGRHRQGCDGKCGEKN